jgi:hypothetical protein
MMWKIIAVLIVAGTLVNFLREGRNFPLPQVLPLSGGDSPEGMYTLGGIIAVLIILWGLSRIGRPKTDDTDTSADDFDETEDDPVPEETQEQSEDNP